MKQVNCINCKNISCLFRNSHSAKWLESFSFQKGEHVFQEGMQVTGLFIVKNGGIEEYYLDKKGNKIITQIAIDGNIFSHRDYSAVKHSFSAIATENSQICFFSKQFLYQVCLENPDLSLKLMNYFSDELNKSDERKMQLTHPQ